MNKLFYIIYNSYYKHGEYKKDIPTLTVGAIFGIFFSSIGRSILDIIGWINPIYYPIKLSKPFFWLLLIAYSAIVYFAFYHNKRYQKIYEAYKEDVFLNSQKGKFFGFFIVFGIILLPVILALIHNKIFLGYWIRIS